MATDPVIHLRIRVTGKVQGVRYRRSTWAVATRLLLRGTVRNMADGSVLIEAEGQRAALDTLIAWCRTGPPLARVQDLEITEGPVENSSGFSMVR